VLKGRFAKEEILNSVLFAVAIGACVLVFVLALIIHRQRQNVISLKAILESMERPLLFYDRRGRLVFHSAGLILFKKESIRAIRRLEARPTGQQTLTGELIIDFNRYRYRSKSLEYKPGTFGTIIFLEYLGSTAAK
jgi:hypothetical protein